MHEIFLGLVGVDDALSAMETLSNSLLGAVGPLIAIALVFVAMKHGKKLLNDAGDVRHCSEDEEAELVAMYSKPHSDWSENGTYQGQAPEGYSYGFDGYLESEAFSLADYESDYARLEWERDQERLERSGA